MDRLLYICGALAGFAGAAIGAFGAHALKGRIPPELFGTFETAVRYHLYHALALFAAAWGYARWQQRAFGIGGGLFLVGIVCFAGSIYLHAWADVLLPGVAPAGGMALFAGWLCLAWGAYRAPRKPTVT
ncbi:MAG TPA: DUF423 domain-containing protein [Steroidobacteraceae bacterium]|nr:DUF423 domain-containing protein [Steroidobacteraceae bacterium]